jgi:hypothetical protein
MTPENREREPFAVKDCALVAIATGRRAQNLRELRDALRDIHPGSIYYHFWGGLLRPTFDNPEYNNDFAVWARGGLHDQALAERLAVIDPTDYTDLDDIRRELIDVVEERLDENEWIPWSKADNQFHFMRSQIVVFDTSNRISDPEELFDAVPRMSVSSIFYHVIDARRRSVFRVDDFRAWLWGFGDTYRNLCMELGALDPFFSTLTELRRRMSAVFADYFGRSVT